MSSARILVVDDEQGIREGCRRVLTAEGHEVDTADDGAAGLEAFRADHYDLVLVDLRMPGLSGMELLGALREHDADAVAVIITAYASLDTAVEATKRGAYDYLAKPFTPDELMAIVTRGLAHCRLLTEARRLREQRERDLLALASEQSRLRTIIDCMADGLLVMNRDHQLVLYNPAALRLLRRDELTLGDLASRCLDCPELVDTIETTLKTQAPTRTQREFTIGAGQDETVVRVTAVPVVDEKGEGLGVIAVLRDVTAQKEVERVKASFVNMVSHELRAPLSAARGYLDVILDGFVGDNPEKERRMLTRVRARTDGLLSLVDDLLTVSRLDQPNLPRTVEPVAVAELLSDTVELFAAEAEAHQVRIQYAVPATQLSVMANREELRQLFTNLISNAVKYNRAGGSVTVTVDMVGENVRVAVSDTGLGIPADAIPDLGREFYRVKTSETREIVGTGLGLSVVKRILAAYHGRLEIASREGEGSTFTVFLPKLATAGEKAPAT
ncbi:MAG: response regulator [Armatimonadota bacterium]|nr:MAG: response regulator [Armatimonadota bacterium]